MLLGSQDRARPTDTNPACEIRSGNAIVLHTVEGNETASAAEARLAVNSHATDGAFGNIEEFLDDLLRRSRAIQEVEIEVLDASLEEAVAIVLFLIESDDSGDA